MRRALCIRGDTWRESRGLVSTKPHWPPRRAVSSAGRAGTLIPRSKVRSLHGSFRRAADASTGETMLRGPPLLLCSRQTGSLLRGNVPGPRRDTPSGRPGCRRAGASWVGEQPELILDRGQIILTASPLRRRCSRSPTTADPSESGGPHSDRCKPSSDGSVRLIGAWPLGAAGRRDRWRPDAAGQRGKSAGWSVALAPYGCRGGHRAGSLRSRCSGGCGWLGTVDAGAWADP